MESNMKYIMVMTDRNSHFSTLVKSGSGGYYEVIDYDTRNDKCCDVLLAKFGTHGMYIPKCLISYLAYGNYIT